MSFTEIANERGMTSAATLLGELTWDCEPHTFQRVDPEVLSSSVEMLLQLLGHLSLVPSIANALLDLFPDRPLERALIAYDIATCSLLGSGDAALLERITRELAPLRQLGPLAPVAVPRDRVDALIEAVRPAPDAPPLVRDFESLPSLAALVQLTLIRQTLAEDSQIVDAVLAHAKTLSRADLPSLAVAFLQILWNAFTVQRALDLMVEVALDHDMLHALPEMRGQDDHSIQLQAYLLVRMQLAQFNTVGARHALEALQAHPAVRDSRDPKLVVAGAELDIMDGKPVTEEVAKLVEKAGDVAAGWPYASRISDAITMRAMPDRTAAIVDTFVTMFGNDAYLWAHARDNDDVRTQVLPVLSREVRFASHDPHVWRAVSIFVEDGEAIGAQIDQRMQAQLDAVFGSRTP